MGKGGVRWGMTAFAPYNNLYKELQAHFEFTLLKNLPDRHTSDSLLKPLVLKKHFRVT